MRPDLEVMSWLHVGDLHTTQAGKPNEQNIRRIVGLVNALPPGSLEFALLPGDVAENGAEAQYELVRQGVSGLQLPLHILPGDHDFQPGSLDAFYRVLGSKPLPYAITAKGVRCLFLDVVSAGTGGPDFRLDTAQLDWAEREIELAEGAVAVFMHTYPADLRAGADRLLALVTRPRVLCVDMGHTHYNELANDGRTIFMATRSIGQIEEGSPGFSIAALDGRCVSWRFKPLENAWPFVLVTRPADRRLVFDSSQLRDAGSLVRAKVFGDAPIKAVEVRVADRGWMPMERVARQAALWQASCRTTGEVVRIRARDTNGRQDEDVVEPAPHGWQPPRRAGDGSDLDRVGVWPQKGILGTQLGPNRNGHQW